MVDDLVDQRTRQSVTALTNTLESDIRTKMPLAVARSKLMNYGCISGQLFARSFENYAMSVKRKLVLSI
jgi:hypothetical protein